MKVILKPSSINGDIRIPSSKSVMHRVLICAALSDKAVTIDCFGNSRDIEATTNCLRAMNADISICAGDNLHNADKNTYEVRPIDKKITGVLDCDECGSTLRFLIPVNAALEADASFTGRGRLMQRPMGALLDELKNHGISVVQSENEIKISGRLQPGTYNIPGNISSQFISGLLMALPLLHNESVIRLTTKPESLSYISITLEILKLFGIDIVAKDNNYYISKEAGYTAPDHIEIEGDWSNAAFWIAGAVLSSEKGLNIKGLNINSTQGDKKIIDILREMGADIRAASDNIYIKKSKLKGIEIDAADIPDLVPILSVAASAAEGKTTIYNVERLKLKESDRIASTLDMINNLGGKAYVSNSAIVIEGKNQLSGGEVNSCNDHRIAMAAAAASVYCAEPVIINGAEAVEKSYPDFFRHFTLLTGGEVHGIE